MKRKKNIRHDTSVRNPGKFLFDFSNWESLSGKEYHELFMKAKRFYYEETNDKTLIDEVHRWTKDKYSEKDLNKIKRNTTDITTNIGVLCKLIRSGCPDYNEKQNDYWKSLKGTTGELNPLSSYIVDAVDRAISCSIEEVEEEPSKPSITIQDRMLDQVSGLLDSLEVEIDNFMLNKRYNIDQFDPYSMMLPVAKQPHVAIIKKHIQPYFEELEEIENIDEDDEDMRYAYAHMTTARKRNYRKFLNKIVDAADMIAKEKKEKVVRKPRKPKAIDHTKLVSRVKYKVKDVDLGLVSVNPIDLIHSKEVWVYNTKQKRLGYYTADELIKTMTVRGTSLVDIDKNNSMMKTVRKPDEFLKNFMTLTNMQKKKEFANLTTKPSVAAGRLNEDTIILAIKK